MIILAVIAIVEFIVIAGLLTGRLFGAGTYADQETLYFCLRQDMEQFRNELKSRGERDNLETILKKYNKTE